MEKGTLKKACSIEKGYSRYGNALCWWLSGTLVLDILHSIGVSWEWSPQLLHLIVAGANMCAGGVVATWLLRD